MAKTTVTLFVDGFVEREVSHVSYKFLQATDKEGQTTGIPRGGKITVRVKARNDGKEELLNWMIEKSLAKDGKVEFMDSSDTTKLMKNLEFKQAYCVDFTEHWEDPDGNPPLAHWEEIVITCKEINLKSVHYENEWA